MDFTDMRLKKLAESDFAEIFEGVSNNFYVLREFPLSEKESKFAKSLQQIIQRKSPFSELNSFSLPKDFSDSFRDQIVSVVEINGLVDVLPSKTIFLSLLESMIDLVSKVSFVSNKGLFAEIVLHNAIGLKQLYFFSFDDELEELMVNAPDSIFVFHKKFGMCKVNLSLDEKSIDALLRKIAVSSGKSFDEKFPLLDAHLPDGSRVNATFSEISPKGVSITIRKFSPTPLTVLDLVSGGTCSSEVAAFLWVVVDGFGAFPKNILVVGGTASGKTTMLNILANFMRLHERVISIEDTLELSLLGRDNWVALEAKHSIDEEVTMNQLLKNSLRMRPDRLIVGEVRGEEATTLFTAMDNGHAGCLGTVHANNSREAIIKLQERPFSVPQSMLPLVDLIVVMQRKFTKNSGLKRTIVEIAEVSRMENKVLLGNIYDFDEAKGCVRRTDVPSHLMDSLAAQSGLTKNEIKKEIDTRRMIIEWMIEKNVSKPLDVLEVIQTYYYNPKKVLEMVSSEG